MTDTFRILLVAAGMIVGISDFDEPGFEASDRACAAFAVWTEARGESLRGQVAVAEVILARRASPDFPAGVCEIVAEPDQFHGVRDWRRGDLMPWDADREAWDVALQVVDGVFLGEMSSGCAGALHFFGGRTPVWARSMPVLCEIDGHRFVGPAP